MHITDTDHDPQGDASPGVAERVGSGGGTAAGLTARIEEMAGGGTPGQQPADDLWND